MENITNIAIDSYTADGQERYIFNVDLEIGGVMQNVVYCACPLDTEDTGKELYAKILEIKQTQPERIKSHVNYHKDLQQFEYDNHNYNTAITRQTRFKNEADGLFLKYQETQVETDRQLWVDKKNQIRLELPYIEDMSDRELQDKYPLLFPRP
jgi:Tfp pilus assembly protein PilF